MKCRSLWFVGIKECPYQERSCKHADCSINSAGGNSQEDTIKAVTSRPSSRNPNPLSAHCKVEPATVQSWGYKTPLPAVATPPKDPPQPAAGRAASGNKPPTGPVNNRATAGPNVTPPRSGERKPDFCL